jgi:hypothetical protein
MRTGGGQQKSKGPIRRRLERGVLCLARQQRAAATTQTAQFKGIGITKPAPYSPSCGLNFLSVGMRVPDYRY